MAAYCEDYKSDIQKYNACIAEKSKSLSYADGFELAKAAGLVTNEAEFKKWIGSKTDSQWKGEILKQAATDLPNILDSIGCLFNTKKCKTPPPVTNNNTYNTDPTAPKPIDYTPYLIGGIVAIVVGIGVAIFALRPKSKN